MSLGTNEEANFNFLALYFGRGYNYSLLIDSVLQKMFSNCFKCFK